MPAKAQPAQTSPADDTPTLEFVCELHVKLGQTYTVGQTAHGARVVIPITGGTFEGPNMKGTVLDGGADYQLVDQKQGRNEIEAIYSIKTDDGVYIHIRNCGLIVTGKDTDGKPSFYFRCAPKFEAPSDSKYNWLNNSLFLCKPGGFNPDGISLRVWRVL
ncbi:MAG: DUF3237 domain-containing protein [Salinivirgaceae bacterium]|nr:DUF3237 domain-containing protein [Salinivirgaceae bacterium]